MTRTALAIAAVLLASTARAEGAADASAEAARQAVRAALLERLPTPSRPPALPDRALGPARLPGAQMAARGEAERAAREHAARAARQHARGEHGEAGRRGAMGGCAGESGTTGDCSSEHGMEHMDPAEMMRSRGMMPDGGPMHPPSTPGQPPMQGMPRGGTSP